MKHRINRISIHQSSKVVAIVYLSLILLFLIPVGFITFLRGVVAPSEAILYLFAPLLWGAMAYLITALWCWMYNLVTRRVGGVEFSVETQVD